MVDQKKTKFDVIVVGGGPGGYVAAIRCSQLGKKVALVEANHLGGICLNWGCIPTKALLKSAEVYNTISHANDYGITVKDVSFDLTKIVSRSRDVATKLSSGIKHLMKKNNVTVFDGFGSICGKNTIKVSKTNNKDDYELLTAENIILATGARARNLPNLTPDGEYIVTYKDAMVPKTMPKKLLVVGSGAIGIEFASFYKMLGVDVTVVEVADKILPVEDDEISKIAEKSFKDQGMNIHTSSVVRSLDVNKSKKQVTATIKDKNGKEQKLTIDRVILAVGIVANTENLGLDATKIKLEKGHIVTDEFCHTDEDGIYAIGDLVKGPWLAHKASHEGVIVAEKIANLNPKPLKYNNIPGCTYCTPQIASVGITEKLAKSKNINIKIGKFPYSANGKAIASGSTTGLVKTIFCAETGELLGAHIVGSDATEMINGYIVGKTLEATEKDFMHTIFPHPTLSEMMHESVLDAFDEAIHI